VLDGAIGSPAFAYWKERIDTQEDTKGFQAFAPPRQGGTLHSSRDAANRNQTTLFLIALDFFRLISYLTQVLTSFKAFFAAIEPIPAQFMLHRKETTFIRRLRKDEMATCKNILTTNESTR
jgi:hypothetical protein